MGANQESSSRDGRHIDPCTNVRYPADFRALNKGLPDALKLKALPRRGLNPADIKSSGRKTSRSKGGEED
jgi:hypothetical protein